MKMKNSTAFHLAVIALMKSLSLLFKSNGFLRRIISQPIEIDWLGGFYILIYVYLYLDIYLNIYIHTYIYISILIFGHTYI
jgi:hypothetical protein